MIISDDTVFCLSTGKWATRFGQSGVMENFQVDGSGPVRIPMMHQGNYPIKMGADSDLSCTVSVLCSPVSQQCEH